MTGDGASSAYQASQQQDPAAFTFAGSSLTRALEHAYYQRDVEALRRIAGQAEARITELQARVPVP